MCRIESKTKPPQSPPIPTHELTPVHSQVAQAREPMGVDQKGNSVKRRRQRQKRTTARETYSLARRDIAKLLDDERVAAKMASQEVKYYRELALGNISMAELAVKLNTSEIGASVLVEDWEHQIIQHAFYFKLLSTKRPTRHQNTDGFESTVASGEAAQDAEVLGSGGESIGGRIVSRGPKMAEGKTFTDEMLDSFDRSGRLYTTGNRPTTDNGGPDYDDYGEDSGA
jgi:hypothetical protein